MKERIDWELQKENQEKKTIARSARNKVTHTSCKLPSDFMTKKEKLAMNGEVMTMKMNKPVKYQAFKLWPVDLQREYLENLVKEFNASINSVAKMMGVAFSSFHLFLTSRHLRDVFPKSSKMNHDQIINWELFCKGEWKGYPYPFTRDTEQDELEKNKEQALQNATESHENALGATNSIEEGTDTKEEFSAVKSPIEAEKTVIDLLTDRVNKQLSEPASSVNNAIGCIGDSFNKFGQDVFKAEKHSDNDETEYETYPMTFTLFSFDMRDVKSWDDVFEMLRKFPLPEKNVLSVAMSERLYPIRGEDCNEKP